MAERPRFIDRIEQNILTPVITCLLFAGTGIGMLEASSASASAPEQKKPNCKITEPHFKEASRSSVIDDYDYMVDAVRMKDCLGTVLFCLQDVSDFPRSLDCNWGDYNRRAHKKFKEANKPR